MVQECPAALYGGVAGGDLCGWERSKLLVQKPREAGFELDLG